MARSGSYDFTVSRIELIRAALRLARGSQMPAGKRGSQEEDDASQALNMMVKSWQANGVGMWKNAEIALFPEYGEDVYSLGPTGDHAAITYVKTAVAADVDSGGSAITVDSITGMSASDNIGVQLDGGTLQWTTIDGSPSGVTVNLAAALTDDVSEDATVYTYTTGIQRPLSITEIRLVQDSNERPVSLKSRNEYMRLSQKSSTGKASMAYVDPQLDDIQIRVWPTCDDVGDYFKLTARIPMEDFDASANNADFPVEWLRALKWNLADEIFLEYDPSPGKEAEYYKRKDIIHKSAVKFLDEVSQFDWETDSVYFEAG